MSHRLLVLDDYSANAEDLKLILSDEGYIVDTASDSDEALEAMRRNPVDLLITDVLHPGLDGFELVRQIRLTSNLPIIILTGFIDSIYLVIGLESGADDYMTKWSFHPDELVSRVHSLLLPVHSGEPNALRIGSFEIHPNEETARCSGTLLSLTRMEFRLLKTLASRPGRVFSPEQLLSEVWRYGYYGDPRIVDVHIARLRAKVEDDPHNPMIIRTVRGIGYMATDRSTAPEVSDRQAGRRCTVEQRAKPSLRGLDRFFFWRWTYPPTVCPPSVWRDLASRAEEPELREDP